MNFKSNNQTMFKRLITDERILSFKQQLLNIDWKDLYLLDNANDSYKFFIRVFTDFYDQCFPVVQETLGYLWLIEVNKS